MGMMAGISRPGRCAVFGMTLLMFTTASVLALSTSDAAISRETGVTATRCGSYGRAWSTLARNAYVRVFTKARLPRDWRERTERQQRAFARGRFGTVYACSFGARTERIAVDAPNATGTDERTRALPRYAVSGRFFAYHRLLSPWETADSYGVERLNVTTGETTTLSLEEEDFFLHCKQPVPSGIQVTNRGTVAYMSCAAGIPTVVIQDATGERVVDQSSEIVVGSLRRIGTMLRWMRGSKVRTVEIR